MARFNLAAADFVIVTADAYVDHPSFGVAIIGRLLEAEGYTVGIIARPDPGDVEAFRALGRPRLAFLVSGGAIDSMVCKYTANRKPRSEDEYSPAGDPVLCRAADGSLHACLVNGKPAHARPDRAVIHYSARCREAYKGVPVIAGGLEASLRRLSHYDYLSDTVRKPIIVDAKADLVVYGMAERAIVEVAARLKAQAAANADPRESAAPGTELPRPGPGVGRAGTELPRPETGVDRAGTELPDQGAGVAGPAAGVAGPGTELAGGVAVPAGHPGHGSDTAVLRGIPGTVWRTSRAEEVPADALVLPSHDEVAADPALFAESFSVQYRNTDPGTARRLCEKAAGQFVVQEPPAPPLSPLQLDRVYALPFMRAWHPVYDAHGGVPALAEVSFSITSSRGCYGACAFCALAFHQGRIVSGRSKQSIVDEARKLVAMPGFKGYIHDIGGPTANFRGPACRRQAGGSACVDRRCLVPEPCPSLEVSHRDYLDVLRAVRALPGVKKAFVRSGIRFDYVMADPDPTFLEELALHHVSGQLKVAPEHVSDRVLGYMGKPRHGVYTEFARRWSDINRRHGLKQFLVPYFIASHPGSDLADAVQLAEYLRDAGFVPDQVQDFYPTPGTLATAMYHTGLDPLTGKPVFVAKGARQRAMQRALLQYNRPENRELVREALKLAGRTDLIGRSPGCLVP